MLACCKCGPEFSANAVTKTLVDSERERECDNTIAFSGKILYDVINALNIAS